MRSLTRRKARLTEGAFLVEGKRLVEEAVAHSGSIRSVILREDVDPAWVEELHLDTNRIRFASADVFNASTNVEHAQGVAAVCHLPEPQIDREFLKAQSPWILILDRVRDPGNLGTTLRSAAAAGWRIVLISDGSVDPYAPKVVRAGMGAHFLLTIADLTPELRTVISGSDRAVVLADAHAENSMFDYAWKNTQALVVSGETEALSSEVEQLVTHRIAIPMAGGVESLNAGVAASILMFDARRKTTNHGGIM